jgi:prepilin-type N-terminal cleavage/methylation domain-containing protein
MILTNRFRRGVSLIEILMVLVIIALLATLAFPLYAALKARAGLAGCLSNLRVIGVGLNVYLQDHDMIWPQLPRTADGKPDYFSGDPAKLSSWWEKTLEPYGVYQKHWICPSDESRMNADPKTQPFTASYGVTFFDELPNTAFRWAQPWAKESSGMHGTRGPNMLMPDGTILEGLSVLDDPNKNKGK